MNKELRDRISETISKQEGQNYPCSNQIVLCGFFSNRKTWDEFCKNNDNIEYFHAQDYVILKNGERWKWFGSVNNCRGYRFYKIKVSSDINEKIFFEQIYPLCSIYCKEIKWI